MAKSILDFDRPPVTEVALALQFAAPKFETLDIAAFERKVKEEFPRRAEHPSQPPMGEQFDQAPEPAAPFRVELLKTPPSSRFWFLTDDDTRLIQIQHDLIAYNWRKMKADASYPRYANLRDDLAGYLATAEEVMREQGRSGFEPNWCEVTYVDHVTPVDGESLPPLDEVLSIVAGLPEDAFLPEPEDAQLAIRFRIHEQDEPVGRCTITAASGRRTEDGQPIWVIHVTTKIRTAQPTLDAAFASFDLGHEWAVRGFRDVTTGKMHEHWGLQEDH